MVQVGIYAQYIVLPVVILIFVDHKLLILFLTLALLNSVFPFMVVHPHNFTINFKTELRISRNVRRNAASFLFNFFKMIEKKLLFIIKIFLIVIIPLLTLGFGLFEKTSFYNFIFKFSNIENALLNKFVTNYNDPRNKTIKREDKEFNDIWKLIKANSSTDLDIYPTPYGISGFKINNVSTVTLPSQEVVELIPDSAPIAALYCPIISMDFACPEEKIIIFGTIQDLKNWHRVKKENLKIKLDLFFALLSISIGFYIHIRENKKVIFNDSKQHIA